MWPQFSSVCYLRKTMALNGVFNISTSSVEWKLSRPPPSKGEASGGDLKNCIQITPWGCRVLKSQCRMEFFLSFVLLPLQCSCCYCYSLLFTSLIGICCWFCSCPAANPSKRYDRPQLQFYLPCTWFVTRQVRYWLLFCWSSPPCTVMPVSLYSICFCFPVS